MKKIILALLGVIAVTTVFADDMSSVNNPVYIDANAGIMNSIGTGTNTSFATNLNVGYMFNQYLGVEGGGFYSPVNTNNSGFSLNYYSFDGAVKGVLPLSNVFDLYGKLGLAYNTFDASASAGGFSVSSTQNSWGALMGVGAQFNISHQWSLHIEDDYIAQFNAPTGIDNPNLVLAGAEFKF